MSVGCCFWQLLSFIAGTICCGNSVLHEVDSTIVLFCVCFVYVLRVCVHLIWFSVLCASILFHDEVTFRVSCLDAACLCATIMTRANCEFADVVMTWDKSEHADRS